MINKHKAHTAQRTLCEIIDNIQTSRAFASELPKVWTARGFALFLTFNLVWRVYLTLETPYKTAYVVICCKRRLQNVGNFIET